MTIERGPDDPVFGQLIDSEIKGKSWLVRAGAVHARSKTYRRDEPDREQSMNFPTLDWQQLLVYVAQIAGAFLLVLPVAWGREKSTRIMGLRTFPLVSVASCAYVLIAVSVIGPAADAQSRIIQGLMTGIGFIGGGAILKDATSCAARPRPPACGWSGLSARLSATSAMGSPLSSVS